MKEEEQVTVTRVKLGNRWLTPDELADKLNSLLTVYNKLDRTNRNHWIRSLPLEQRKMINDITENKNKLF